MAEILSPFSHRTPAFSRKCQDAQSVHLDSLLQRVDLVPNRDGTADPQLKTHNGRGPRPLQSQNNNRSGNKAIFILGTYLAIVDWASLVDAVEVRNRLRRCERRNQDPDGPERQVPRSRSVDGRISLYPMARAMMQSGLFFSCFYLVSPISCFCYIHMRGSFSMSVMPFHGVRRGLQQCSWLYVCYNTYIAMSICSLRISMYPKDTRRNLETCKLVKRS